MSLATRRLKKRVRRFLAQPALQQSFRLLYRVALAGMNYGGAGSETSAGDEQALLRLRRLDHCVVFDVGANVGGYVQHVVGILGNSVTVHAFEPSRAAFSELERGFGGRPNLHLRNVGVGAEAGTAVLYASKPGSVLATTFRNPLYGSDSCEEISIVSLDQYCAENRIERIDLLKLDLEGGEHDALRGANGMLERGAIRMIQFEFGQPSIGARTFFADLFALLAPRYELYRVLPRGLELLPRYHETLEVFMSTNYLAVLKEPS